MDVDITPYRGSVSHRALIRLLVLALWAGVVHVVTTPWPATLPLKIEVTFGATTVDVFPDVLKQEIRITCGAQPEGNVQAGSVAFELDNLDGDYTPDHPLSQYYPYVQLGVPVKVWVYWNGTWWLRFTGRVSEWKPFWPKGDLSTPTQKGDARVTVVAAGLLRQLGQGKAPLRSPLFRSLAGVTPGDYVPHEYWPFEDGQDATQIASGLAGKPSVAPAGPITFASDGPTGSAPLPRMGAGFNVTLPISSYVDAGKWAISMAINVPAEPAAATTLLEVPVTGGTAAKWKLEIIPGSPAEIWWRAYDAAGALVPSLGTNISLMVISGDEPTEAEFFSDQWFVIVVSSWQAGGMNHARIGIANGDLSIQDNPGIGVAGTTHSALTDRMVISVDSNLAGIGLGHYAIFTDANYDVDFDVFDTAPALIGWAGEWVQDRLDRLCREFGIPLTRIGSSTKQMGPQQIDTLYNLLVACAQVDMGILHEQRDGNGLVYRCLLSLYNQTSALTLDAQQNQLANPFRPALDDFGVRNDVTIQRRGGSEYRSVVETGPKSIQDPPDGVGTYDEKLILDLYTDEQTRFNATWRTWLGTWPGMRYPRISPDINAVADVATTWLGVDLGDLEQAINLPPQHPISVVEAIVRGYTETLTPTSWTVVTNAAPAGPYQVGRAGDGSNASAWPQTGPATALAARLAPGATSMTVTPDGALFDTTANLTLNPLSLILGGEVVPVQSISGAGPTQTVVVQRTLPQLDHPIGRIVQVYRPLIACH